MHARLVRRGGEFFIVDAGSKNGTLINGVPPGEDPVRDGDVIECGSTFFLFRELEPSDETHPDLDSTETAPAAPGLTTLSPSLTRQFSALRSLAASKVPLLILGDSGTGKEVVARALHHLSGRRGPMIAVNCGALPESLVESELFGSRKGSFSGAVEDRLGLVRASDGGTLFLDADSYLQLYRTTYT